MYVHVCTCVHTRHAICSTQLYPTPSPTHPPTSSPLPHPQATPQALLSLCDDLRDKHLVPLGVQLEDRPDGSAVWKLADPAVLAAAVAARGQEAAAARLRKVQAAVKLKRAEVERFEKLCALPSVQEALGDKYGAFDASTGPPTHDAQGAVLEGKALTKAVKDFEKQKSVRAPLEKRRAEEGEGFLEVLREQLRTLEGQAAALEGGEGGGSQE